jgi:hypothetical protein
MTTAHIRTTWGPRAETPDSAAEKLLLLLEAIGDISGSLTGWRDQALSKKKALMQPVVTPSRDDLRRRLLVGRRVVDADDTISERGASLSWWTAADDDEAAVLTVRLGITAPKFGFNAATLQLPDSNAVPTLYEAETARRLLSTIIDVIRPDRGVWITREIEQPQKESNRELPDGSVVMGTVVGQPAGWATYLRDGEGAGFNRALLPATAEASSMADGVLVTLAGTPTKPAPADVLAVRSAMGYSVSDVQEAAVAPPPAAPLPTSGASAGGAPVAEPHKRETPSAAEEQAQPSSTELTRRGEA